MQLRRAHLADADTIARYHHQCWIEAYAGVAIREMRLLKSLGSAHGGSGT